MAKAILETILLNVAALRVDLRIAKLSLRWDIIPERTSKDTVDVDFE
jgi:hypothetical protein